MSILSDALDALALGLVEHRARGEEIASALAAHRAERVDVWLRLRSLEGVVRREEHRRHLGAGEIAGPRAALRDGDPGSKRPAHDATEQSLITMGLVRPRKANV